MRKFLAAVLSSTIISTMAVPASAQDVPAFRVPLGIKKTEGPNNAVFSWVADTSSCTKTCGTGTRTTTFQCQNVANFDAVTGGFGSPEEASFCHASIGPAPSDSASACTNFAGCGFDWVKPPEIVTVHPVGANPLGRPGCGNVQREFAPQCQRVDGTVLAKGDHAFCQRDLPDYNDVAAEIDGALGYDRTEVETSACNGSDHAWNSTAWSEWTSTCSSGALRTRAVTCKRKFDGSTQADSACTTVKPANTELQAQYGGCLYGAGNATDWSPWASNCSGNTSRTRTFQCLRSDGSIVSNSECTARSINLTETQTGANFDGCTYTSGVISSSCSSPGFETKKNSCRRSDGQSVATSYCGIAAQETVSAPQCVEYSWVTGAWSELSTCSNKSQFQTRSVTCNANPGGVVADSQCVVAKPASTNTQSCSMAPGSGAVLGRREEWRHSVSYCMEEGIISNPGFTSFGPPAWCTNLGGKWYGTSVRECYTIRNGYEEGIDERYVLECREY